MTEQKFRCRAKFPDQNRDTFPARARKSFLASHSKTVNVWGAARARQDSSLCAARYDSGRGRGFHLGCLLFLTTSRTQSLNSIVAKSTSYPFQSQAVREDVEALPRCVVQVPCGVFVWPTRECANRPLTRSLLSNPPHSSSAKKKK